MTQGQPSTTSRFAEEELANGVQRRTRRCVTLGRVTAIRARSRT